MTSEVFNVNILGEDVLPPPREIKTRVPISPAQSDFIFQSRTTLNSILEKKDHRRIVVVGPCSIHDVDAAKEYAQKLKLLSDELKDTLFIVMRVYFEKPRTAVGWKGLINDPRLDDSFRIEEGLTKARGLLSYLADLKVPIGTEALDPISPQYLHDFVSWTAIGARTTESQTHREMSSGLSTPVGFKNGTDGGIEVAINALKSVSRPHHFLGINAEGQVSVMHTRGNRYGHIILRGGGGKPNYDSVNVALCERELSKAGLPKNIMIDCSHGNSMKDPTLQPIVLQNCVNQILEGNESIVGFMIESNLFGGSQSIPEDRSKLLYGVSVTDGCIDWETTETSLRDAAKTLRL